MPELNDIKLKKKIRANKSVSSLTFKLHSIHNASSTRCRATDTQAAAYTHGVRQRVRVPEFPLESIGCFPQKLGSDFLRVRAEGSGLMAIKG